MMRILFFIFLFLGCLLPLESLAEKVDQAYRKTARKYGFVLESKPRFGNGIKGVRISTAETEKELQRFFKALEALPVNFVKQSGISKVMICKNLLLNDEKADGVATEDCIYLTTGFHPRTVYHELFHVFDSKRNNSRWTRLNKREFYYQGSNFYPQKDNRKNRKRKEKNKSFEADFVSKYAQSFEWEDRAETFAYMVAEKEKFLERTKKSPVLQKKMLFIINLTSKRSLLGKEYWACLQKKEDK